MYGNNTERLLFLKKSKSDECFKEMPAVKPDKTKNFRGAALAVGSFSCGFDSD